MKNIIKFITLIICISSAINFAQDDENNSNSNFFYIPENKLLLEGITYEASYTADLFKNIEGGLANSFNYLHNIDFSAFINFSKLAIINNSFLKIRFINTYGKDPCEMSGTIQGTSNIEAYDTWKVYELYFVKNFDNVSFLLGLYDLNSEFDVQENSAIFVHPSHGIGPEFSLSGLNGPSIFPTTSLAFRVIYNFKNNYTFSAAILDGIPGDLNNPNGTTIRLKKNDGALIISEIKYNSQNGLFSLFKTFGVGIWYYTSKFNDILNGYNNFDTYTGNEGFYFFGEGDISENSGWFIRSGFSNSDINPVNFYVGSGFTIQNMFFNSFENILGFAIASSRNSYKSRVLNDLIDDGLKENEVNFELTFLTKPIDLIQIQFDLQYNVNPSGVCRDTRNSFLSALRLVFSL